MINPVINTPPSSAQSANAQSNNPQDGFGAVLAKKLSDTTVNASQAQSTATADQAQSTATTSQVQNTATTSEAKSNASQAQNTASTSEAKSTASQAHNTTRQALSDAAPAKNSTTAIQALATEATNKVINSLLHKHSALKATMDSDVKSQQDKTSSVIEATSILQTTVLPATQTLKTAVIVHAKSDKDKTPPTTDATQLLANPNVSVASGIKTGIDPTLQSKPRTAIDSTLKSASQKTPEKIDPPTHLADTKLQTAIQSDLNSNAQTVKTTELAVKLPSEQALIQTAATQISANMPSKMVNTQASIAAPVSSNAWPDEFSQKISWMSTQQSQVAELHLNPPDLGPMSVVLSVANNQATALFTSPHAEVRQAIENAMPQLRERLADNGIMLGNATVSDQTPRDSGAGNFTNQHNPARMEMTSLSPAEVSPVITTITRQHNGLLDTFA